MTQTNATEIIKRTIEAAYDANKASAVGLGRTPSDLPAVGFPKAAEMIVTASADIRERFGTTADTVYRTLVGLALEQITNGWGPTIVNFQLHNAMEGTDLPSGEKLATYTAMLVASGHVGMGIGKGGKRLWIPVALSRERRGAVKQITATPESKARTSFADLIAVASGVKPTEPAKVAKGKGKATAKGLAGIADAIAAVSTDNDAEPSTDGETA